MGHSDGESRPATPAPPGERHADACAGRLIRSNELLRHLRDCARLRLAPQFDAREFGPIGAARDNGARNAVALEWAHREHAPIGGPPPTLVSSDTSISIVTASLRARP